MKEWICGLIGIIGSSIAGLFGGFDAGLVTLIIFMAADYITGLILAGVFHKSGKSEDGSLDSKAGWKGLCRKGGTLLVILVACRLDLLLGSSFIRDAAIIAFVVNELLSITENLGLMGVPIPEVIKNAITALKNTSNKEDN